MEGEYSFLNPKYIVGVSYFEYYRAAMYTLTICLGCLLSTLVIWGAICYLVPFEKKSIHYSGCGCKMDKHGKIFVFGDHPAESHSEGISPAERHWVMLKTPKVVCLCVSL